MKNKTLLVSVVILAIVGYLVSPYISIYGLFGAIKSGDTYALKRHINFPELKSSLKDEIKSKILKELDQKVKDNRGEDAASSIGMGLAALFGPALVDGAVDAIVTPSGLSAFISDPKNALNSTLKKDESEKTDTIPSFQWKNVEYAFFTGLTEFEVRTDADIILHFSLSGLSWKLDGITLPDKATSDKRAARLKELRIKKIASMSKSELILGYWEWSGKDTGTTLIREIYNFNNDGTMKITLLSPYNIDSYTGIYSLKESEVKIKLNEGESRDIKLIIDSINDEVMAINLIEETNKNNHPIKQDLSKISLSDYEKEVKITENKIKKGKEDQIKSKQAFILSDASMLALRLHTALMEKELENGNKISGTDLSTNITQIGYPFDLNILTKSNYIEVLKTIPPKNLSQESIDKTIATIIKYFDVVNVSSKDSLDMPFLISKDIPESPFNGKRYIIDIGGIDHSVESSDDLKAKIPNRTPAILPEN